MTAQQERFAFEYVTTGRPIVAYRRAYDASDMTPEACSANANKLLNDTAIALRIEHYRRIAEAAMEVTVQQIARELARIGFSDIRDLFDDDGNLLEIHMIPVDARRAIQYVKVVETKPSLNQAVSTRTKEVRFWSKLDALTTMAKWKGMLVEQVDPEALDEFAAMSDEQLEAEYAALEKAVADINHRARKCKKVRVKAVRQARSSVARQGRR